MPKSEHAKLLSTLPDSEVFKYQVSHLCGDYEMHQHCKMLIIYKGSDRNRICDVDNVDTGVGFANAAIRYFNSRLPQNIVRSQWLRIEFSNSAGGQAFIQRDEKAMADGIGVWETVEYAKEQKARLLAQEAAASTSLSI